MRERLEEASCGRTCVR